MTDSEINQIKAFWESGMPKERIYKMLPYSRGKSMKIINSLCNTGILTPREKNKLTIELVAKAWENQTQNPYELANILGYSVHTINTYLQLSGVREGKRPLHNYKDYRNTKFNDIAIELKNGTSVSQISKTFKVSRQYIYQIKNRLEKENAEYNDNI